MKNLDAIWLASRLVWLLLPGSNLRTVEKWHESDLVRRDFEKFVDEVARRIRVAALVNLACHLIDVAKHQRVHFGGGHWPDGMLAEFESLKSLRDGGLKDVVSRPADKDAESFCERQWSDALKTEFERLLDWLLSDGSEVSDGQRLNALSRCIWQYSKQVLELLLAKHEADHVELGHAVRASDALALSEELFAVRPELLHGFSPWTLRQTLRDCDTDRPESGVETLSRTRD